MSTFKNVEEARDFYKDDLFATKNGIIIEELGEDFCICSMKITPEHRNAVGGVMGGAIFTLADMAVSAAANNVYLPTVTQQVSGYFLNNSRSEVFYAKAKARRDGRRACVYNVDVYDKEGKDIAQFVATGSKLN